MQPPPGWASAEKVRQKAAAALPSEKNPAGMLKVPVWGLGKVRASKNGLITPPRRADTYLKSVNTKRSCLGPAERSAVNAKRAKQTPSKIKSMAFLS